MHLKQKWKRVLHRNFVLLNGYFDQKTTPFGENPNIISSPERAAQNCLMSDFCDALSQNLMEPDQLKVVENVALENWIPDEKWISIIPVSVSLMSKYKRSKFSLCQRYGKMNIYLLKQNIFI